MTVPECPKSKSGIHVWIDGLDGEFQTCLYCGARR